MLGAVVDPDVLQPEAERCDLLHNSNYALIGIYGQPMSLCEIELRQHRIGWVSEVQAVAG